MPATYAEIRPSLKTGDILLFSGKGMVSGLIRRLTNSKWSHVGMVVRVPEFDMVLSWESTALATVRDVETLQKHRGVQLVGLRDRLALYDGEVQVRQLAHPIGAESLAALGAFRSEVSGRPYEQSKIELLKSVWDGWGGHNEEDLSSLFCSELVAEAYQRMGLLPGDPPSNEFVPADFKPGRMADQLLLGTNVLGATIGVEG